MDGEENFQNGASCVYYTGSKYKRMSHQYSASFKLVTGGSDILQKSGSTTVLGIDLSTPLTFVVTALTSGDPTPYSTTTASQFFGVTGLNIVSVTGGADVAEFNATTLSGGSSTYAIRSGTTTPFMLTLTYDTYTPSIGRDYTITGDTITLTISTSSVLPGAAPASTSVSKAAPTTIRYKKVVCWGLSPQAVNFAQASTLGHRVTVTIPVDLMNKYFKWTRASGEVAPTGRFNKNPTPAVAGSDFVSQLVEAFSLEYNDLDGVANGLNFSSSALDITGDIKRDKCIYNSKTDTGLPGAPNGVNSTTHYGANDLVMAYLMFKCFGSSSYDPTDIIYNVDDAYNMLSSQQLAEVISASLEAEDALANAAVQPNGKPVPLQLAGDNKGQVDAMFRGFLASDPLRYFLQGVQIPGLFETNFTCPPSDPSVGGNWCLTVGDKIEMPLQLVFRAPVTVLSVQDNVQNPSSATPDSARTEVIKGESATFDCSAQKAAINNVVSIRLQITCAAPSVAGAGSGSTSNPTPMADLMAVGSSVIFYTPKSYGRQTAKPMAVAGGLAPYTYSMAVPYGCPSVAQGFDIDPTTGTLIFTPTPGSPIVQWGKFVVPITVKDAGTTGVSGTQQAKTIYVNVSIDDGHGASDASVCLSSVALNVGYTTEIASTSPALNGVRVNPLYANVSHNFDFIPYEESVVYASPDFGSSGANSCLPASATTNKKNITAPLSYDVITFSYVPPAVNSLSATEPAQIPADTTWSITSVGGRSGASSMPAGFSFTAGTVAMTAASGGAPPYALAYMMINLDPAYTPSSVPGTLTAAPGADYSYGNTSGNKAGEYKFLVTSTDSNGYVQSIPVNIRIALPPPKSAVSYLAVTGTVVGRSYVNGGMLTYSKAAAGAGGLNETLTITNDQGGSNIQWVLTPVGTALVRPTDINFTNSGSTATLTLYTNGITAGTYPYFISSLDNNNVSQTIFFTLNITA